MPAETLTVTLECAGNGRVGLMPLPTGEPWAGQAVGNATWTGVPLHAVLTRAAPHTSAVEVAFAGADHGEYKGGPDIHFIRSLALAHATDPGAHVLIAWAMNGEPLPLDHGAPLRLLVPGWYGMASVKWLARIEVRTAPYEGQFQTKSYMFEWPDRGRESVRTMRPRALITTPARSFREAMGWCAFQAGLFVTWTISWTGSGGAGGLITDSYTTGSAFPVRVAQAEALVTTP